MRAVYQKRYGSPDDLELRDVDEPVPSADEVLVRVRAASVHPDIWHVLRGKPYILRIMGGGLRRPKNPIPGTDLAGIVEEVGGAVERFRPGDEVFGETIGNMQWTNGGTFAEYALAPADNLALKPDNVSFEQAATVPTSGYITLFNLRGSEKRPGQRVLVNGAGGGVGSLTLQLTKANGAHVTAVDTTKKLDLLRRLGADEVIDFTREDFTQRDESYDLVVDIPGNRPFSQIRRVIATGGRYVPIGHDDYGALGKNLFGLIPHFFWLMFLARFTRIDGLRGPREVREPTKSEAMTVFRDLLEAGKITPAIDCTFPFSEAAAALRHLAQGEPIGRVVVVP